MEERGKKKVLQKWIRECFRKNCALLIEGTEKREGIIEESWRMEWFLKVTKIMNLWLYETLWDPITRSTKTVTPRTTELSFSGSVIMRKYIRFLKGKRQYIMMRTEFSSERIWNDSDQSTWNIFSKNSPPIIMIEFSDQQNTFKGYGDIKTFLSVEIINCK